jgi:hypothetical protein
VLIVELQFIVFLILNFDFINFVSIADIVVIVIKSNLVSAIIKGS